MNYIYAGVWTVIAACISIVVCILLEDYKDKKQQEKLKNDKR